MPSLSSNASTYRAGKYTYTGYISTPPQTVVLAGTISAVPTYPALTVSYTLTAGDELDVIGDMTVNFYSAAGLRKATLRVAVGGTISSVSLPVAEFSQGVYDVAIGDTFQVIQTWNIWDRLVSATAALNKDSRMTVSDNTSNPPPVCNSGGLYVGFDTSVNFPGGSTSFTIDPDSSGTITHAWDLIDGTPSTSTSANPSGVVFPVGSRWVQHTATDASNSKDTLQLIWVRVYDRDTDPPLSVQMDTLSASVDQGWRATFKLPVGTEGNITNLPDGAMIVYWEDERYSGSQTSYGSQMSGRSHIKFVGYLVSDSIRITPESNEVTFEAVSPLAILEQTPALPQLMVNKSSPAKWSEVKGLTTKKMFHYLSYWHSSLMDVFDLVWNDGVDLSFQRVSVEGDTLAAQLRDIANSLNVQVTCDRLGRILFTRDPAYLTSAERTSRTKTYDLTTADVMSLDVTRNHRGTVKTVRGEGITTAGKAVFSNSPGNAPAPYGPMADTLAKQIIASQTALNERSGYYFAKVNALYNGQFVPKGARIELPDGYDVFEPAYREFITLTLASSLNSRGIAWDNTTKWTVEAVNVSYDVEVGAKSIDITIDHETTGAAGVTYIPPPETSFSIPSFPPMDVQFPDLPVDPYIDVNGDPIIIPGTTNGNFCEAWSAAASWLVENVLSLSEPPFGENTPDSGLTITDFQWIHLGHPGAYMLANDGTDTYFFYWPDLLSAPETFDITTIAAALYTKIRPTSTAGGVYILNDETGDWCHQFDFTIDQQGWDFTEVGYGTYSAGVGFVGQAYGTGGGVSRLHIGFANAMLTSITVTHTASGYSVGQKLVRLKTDTDPDQDHDLGSSLNGTNVSSTYSQALNEPFECDSVTLFWDGAGSSTMTITSIEICGVGFDPFGSSVNLETRYSTDFGATFAAAETAAPAAGTFNGFDTQKVGTIVLVGTDGQVMKASAGGAYAAYGDPFPTGAQPNAIWIPAKKSNGTSNTGSTPDYVAVSASLTAGNESVFYVSSSGTVFTDITPTIGGEYGIAVSADCIANAFKSGSRYAAVLDFGGTIKLVTSTNAGGAWANRDTVADANYIRYRRGDSTLQQLYIASGGGAVIVSQNHGAALASRTSPESAALIGVEPFG